jgi:hypothetical protein
LRGDVGDAVLLEAIGVTSDFVPSAGVAVEVNVGDGLELRRAVGEGSGDEAKEECES